jgi:hypothetical protein
VAGALGYTQARPRYEPLQLFGEQQEFCILAAGEQIDGTARPRELRPQVAHLSEPDALEGTREAFGVVQAANAAPGGAHALGKRILSAP